MKILRAIIAIAAIVISSLMAIHPNTASASVMSSASYVTQPIAVEANNMSLLMSMVHLHANPVMRVTVKTGNTLTGIAREQHIGWQSLYCANKQLIGRNPDFIKPGERLVIPQHKVSCTIPRMEAKTVAPATTTAHYTAGNSTASSDPSVSQGQPSGSAQQDAWNLLPPANKAAEYNCLNNVIERESGWNIYAQNPTTGAYGIPQALPGSKMAVAGSDWATSAYTQLLWMIDYYIGPIYGDSCGAWNHEVAYGWY